MSDPTDLSTRLKALEEDFAAPKAARSNSSLLIFGILGRGSGGRHGRLFCPERP